MEDDNHHVSDEIMTTYSAHSIFPTDAELLELGIEPSHVYRITNGPETPLASFLKRVEQAVNEILHREEGGKRRICQEG